MARLIYQRAQPTLRLATTLDPGLLLLAAMQMLALGGIGAFIVLTLLNTVLGTPTQDPVYAPYRS